MDGPSTRWSIPIKTKKQKFITLKYAIPADLLADREAAIRKAVAEQGLANLNDIVGETTTELCDELEVIFDIRDDLFTDTNSFLYDSVADLYEELDELEEAAESK